MDCPYCKQPMEKGSIRCHNGYFPLTWRSEETELSRRVETWKQGFFFNRITNLWYCASCDVMIRKFDPSILPNQKK